MPPPLPNEKTPPARVLGPRWPVRQRTFAAGARVVEVGSRRDAGGVHGARVWGFVVRCGLCVLVGRGAPGAEAKRSGRFSLGNLHGGAEAGPLGDWPSLRQGGRGGCRVSCPCQMQTSVRALRRNKRGQWYPGTYQCAF